MNPKTVKALAYARTSLIEMEPEIQLVQIRDYCRVRSIELIPGGEYTDQISGAKERRPALDEALRLLRCGKATHLVVASIDRLSRSLSHLIALVNELSRQGITVIFIRENLVLSQDDPHGRLMLNLLGALSEFELSLIRSRTRLGLKMAQMKGVKLGRPRRVTPALEADIVRMRGEGVPVREIARRMRPKLSRGSIQAVLRRRKVS